MNIEWSDLEHFILQPHEIDSDEDGIHLRVSSKKYEDGDEDSPPFGAHRVLKLIKAKAIFDEYLPRLSNALEDFSDLRCGDYRDKIYALLGLVPKTAG